MNTTDYVEVAFTVDGYTKHVDFSSAECVGIGVSVIDAEYRKSYYKGDGNELFYSLDKQGKRKSYRTPEVNNYKDINARLVFLGSSEDTEEVYFSVNSLEELKKVCKIVKPGAYPFNTHLETYFCSNMPLTVPSWAFPEGIGFSVKYNKGTATDITGFLKVPLKDVHTLFQLPMGTCYRTEGEA